MDYKDFVVTLNKNNEVVYREGFSTSGKAYEFYKDTVKNLTTHLPKGYEITVLRIHDGMIMHSDKIIGTK